MNVFKTLFLLCMTLAIFTPTHSFAQNSPLVKIRILSERTSVKPGDEIWIGTEQSITSGWHTYWKNPGDSGTATTITWTMPKGFEISEIQWPTPKKIPYPPLLNYGYEDQVILLQKLNVPETLPDGPITLTADIDLLVCKEECIPEYGTYTLTLNGPNAAAENNSAYLNAALKNLPENADWETTFTQDDENFILNVTLPETLRSSIEPQSAAFIPEEWGLIQNQAAPLSKINDGTLILKQTKGDRAFDTVEETTGILTFKTTTDETYNVAINAEHIKGMFSNLSPTPETNADSSSISLIQALVFALIGGLILNLMPCVFPVLSIKALSLVKCAEQDPQIARMHGLYYTAGVILSFLAIAGALIMLQSAGAQIGWGFQLQNPFIVGALAYLLFVLGLNLMGFFEFSNPFANMGGKLANKDGMIGSFFAGILATFVAAPCTAPFMAGALGFALIQPPIVSLIVFAALGLGLALPYLSLSFMPALQQIMPKPGAWMNTFKQLLSFPMFLAALWLLWVLAQQSNIMGVAAILLGGILITFAIWLLKSTSTKTAVRLIVKSLSIIGFVLAVILLTIPAKVQIGTMSADYEFGKVYSENALKDALSGDAPIFTEMTAAWCITCKVNHAVAINIPSTKEIFAQNNVEYLIGDWTNEDAEITKYLQKFDRSGVPLYVFYGQRDPVTKQRPAPKVLPQVLTPAIVKNTILEKK